MGVLVDPSQYGVGDGVPREEPLVDVDEDELRHARVRITDVGEVGLWITSLRDVEEALLCMGQALGDRPVGGGGAPGHGRARGPGHPG